MMLKRLVLMSCLMVSGLLTGCSTAHHFTNPFVGQTNLDSQTLPPVRTCVDDVQYFPAGPEEQLPNQKQALEQYRREHQGYATQE